MADPLELILKSQQAAMKLATDTLKTVSQAAVTGVTNPDELLTQVAELSGAVASLAGAVGGLVTATAQPLHDFVARQRELADTVSALADAQAELAAIVARLADGHSATVSALEKLTTPVFALAGTSPPGQPE